MVADASSGSGAASYWDRIRGPWQDAGFKWYWVGSFTQSISQGMQFFVLTWLLLDVTGVETSLGLMFAIYGIPNSILLVPSGIIADRVNRKLLLMGTQAAVGALIAVVALLAMLGAVALWHIFLAAALLGVLQALNMPARLVMLSDLVAERRLLDAMAQFNAAVHIGRIVGPALAGVIIDWWGIAPALFLNTGCYVISVACLLFVRWASSRPAAAREPLLRNFADGLICIRDTPLLLTVMVVTLSFGGFGMSHLQVIPAFFKDTFGDDATRAGLLLTASGIGSLTGSMSLTFMNRAWLYRWLLVCLITFSISLTLFAWSPWYWATWALFLIAGVVSIGATWPLAATIAQLATPPEMRGRVLGVLHLTPGFHYLGALPLTFAAAAYGWPVAISSAAGLCLLVTLGYGVLRKTSRELVARPMTA